VVRDREQGDRIDRGVELDLQRRVLIDVEASGDREALSGGDDLPVDHQPHLPVLHRGEESTPEGIAPIDGVEAALRHHDVVERHRTFGRVGHVHDAFSRRDRARGAQHLGEPAVQPSEPVEAAEQGILAGEDQRMAGKLTCDKTPGADRRGRRLRPSARIRQQR